MTGILALILDLLVTAVTIGLLVFIVLEQIEFTPSSEEEFSPTVSIIIPTRGLDEKWEGNVESFRHLDYDNKYEVLYVVDADDPETCRALQAKGCKVIISRDLGYACGGKVLAQINGLLATHSDAVVFADSDIVVEKSWLKEMVKPLVNHDGVTTFSWPRPTGFGLRNALRAGFWLSGYDGHASMRGFLWGGSMAFKRETTNQEFIDYLKDKIYDDVSITHYIKGKGGKLCFNGRAICYNVYEEQHFIEWSTRLALVVRRFEPIVAGVFFLGALGIVSSIVLGVALGSIAFLLPLAVWWLKGFLISLRLRTVSIAIPTASLASLFVVFALLIATLGTKKVSWRGKGYPI